MLSSEDASAGAVNLTPHNCADAERNTPGDGHFGRQGASLGLARRLLERMADRSAVEHAFRELSGLLDSGFVEER